MEMLNEGHVFLSLEKNLRNPTPSNLGFFKPPPRPSLVVETTCKA